MIRSQALRSLFAAAVAMGLVACETVPQPVTHSQWMVNRIKKWDQIKRCDAWLAMCHRLRAKLTIEAKCFPPEFPLDALPQETDSRTVVRMFVAPGGAVSAVKLMTSSGNPTLDRTAVNAFSACELPSYLRPDSPTGSVFDLVYVWRLGEWNQDLETPPASDK